MNSDSGERFESRNGFPGRPRNCAQDHDPKEGIIVGREVMAQDRPKEPSLAALEGPDHWPWFPFFHGGRENARFVGVADHWPIGFVAEMNGGRESASEGVAARTEQVQIQ